MEGGLKYMRYILPTWNCIIGHQTQREGFLVQEWETEQQPAHVISCQHTGNAEQSMPAWQPLLWA